jgi:hypothetical protein
VSGRSAGVLDRLGTIRERCGRITDHVAAGASPHLTLHRDRLPAAADATLASIRRRYPGGVIPPHSRWRHFDAGGVGRIVQLDAALASHSREAAMRARFDLTVVSVLLDAGAGPDWRYREPAADVVLARSEGLAVATLRAFMRGAFSADASDPFRVDAAALARCDAAALATLFQADAGNPLVGVEGRAAMLRRLGASLRGGRPAQWLDALLADGPVPSIDMQALFEALRDGLRHVLIGGLVRDGTPLGDCWPHPAAGGDAADAGLVPFHKLTQWLAHSLAEPLERGGVRVVDRHALTGLPEYRNGGLLLDTGVLRLRDPSAASRTHEVGSELVVEWRALTVTLLDEIAAHVRAALDRPALPLAAILEGGTWAAGRELAARLRDGRPALAIASDGTVF